MKYITSSSIGSAAGDEHRQPNKYSLRENPKKSMRSLSSSTDFDNGDGDYADELYRCRECGKCLSSWAHLYDHTRIHGGKQRWKLEDHCSNAATLTMAVPKRRRGSRGLMVSPLAPCSYSSASVSTPIQYGFDEEVDGAIEGLIMLSRSVLGFSCDFSDKSSAVANLGSEEIKRFGDTELSSVDAELGMKSRLDGFGRVLVSKIGAFDASLDSEGIELGKDESRFQCADCHKIFSSYRALGGHRSSQKRKKDRGLGTGASACLSMFEENPDHRPKKRKVHICELCGKVFRSGQALGVHRKCHLVQNPSESDADISNITEIPIQQQVTVA